MANCSNISKRLIKCFCDCSELTVEEIEKIYRLPSQETLINCQAKKLFHAFLDKEDLGETSEVKEFLLVYEQCEDYIKDIHDHGKILTESDVEKLSELGLQYRLEKELTKMVLTTESYKIEMCLRRIQGECRNNIELSDKYIRFKNALFEKMRHSNA